MAGGPGIFSMLKQGVSDFLADDCTSMAAAISYYAIFSLPPLLLLIILILGSVVSPQDVQGAVQTQINRMVGPSSATVVRGILAHAESPGGGLVSTLLGVAALIFGALGVFGELQVALNRAWEVKPDPNQGGIKPFLMKRLLSAGMILAIAFLLLVSLAISAALSAFGQALGGLLGGTVSTAVLHVLNIAISFGVITLLFAAIFKVVPDAKINWGSVWVGALITAALFVVGKYLLGLYLGRTNPGEVFGAAGSLALLLLWIYYSSNILLFGAELTQVWARRHGGIRPEKGAVLVERTPHTPEPAGAHSGGG
ncbi:MAG TPA: YihY/virulence factor BrkB family protein [Gemmatimonadales bacterium]|nr:YihY/virulence factor BrkB family protein [Gemmatimonadales bacterium]